MRCATFAHFTSRSATQEVTSTDERRYFGSQRSAPNCDSSERLASLTVNDDDWNCECISLEMVFTDCICEQKGKLKRV